MSEAAEADATRSVADLEPGSQVGEFVVEQLIGTGGMSRVYQARQGGVDRTVAVKILTPSLAADGDYARRFAQEAGVLRDLEHPAILPVYAAGEDHGQLFMVTRLISGPSLEQVLRSGPVAPTRLLPIVRRIASALDYSHARGVVHRDVKPGNVLLDDDGNAYLADFGVAKAMGSTTTVAGRYFGTPRYMAPEQMRGAAGFRADLYSFACLAFEMLTGSPPFAGDDHLGLAVAHATATVPRASEVGAGLSPAVDAVLSRGLAKRPGDRFRSGAEFVDALEEALTVGRARRRPPVRQLQHKRWSGTSVLFVSGLVLVLVLGAATVTAVALWPARPTGPIAGLPAPLPPPTLAGVRRGSPAYAAPLDGTATGFSTAPETRPSSAREAVRFVPGALELEDVQPGGETYSELAMDRGVTTYLGEMDLSVRPGSAVELCWSLRWAIPGELAAYVCADTATGEASFSVFRRGQGKQRIGPSTTIDGLGSGRRVALAVVVQRDRFTLYVDGRRTIDVVDDQVPVATTLPGIEVESTTGTGLVRVEGLRLTRVADA